jgi:hypothetical protein
MSDSQEQTHKAKYTKRFWTNLVLFVVTITAAWIWFNVHLKPHVSARWFGGVTILAAVTFAVGLVKLFVGDDAKNALLASMRSKKTTWRLAALLPVVAFAHLTTASIYVRANTDKGEQYVFVVKRGENEKRVEISKSQPERCITYPFVFGRFEMDVATESPAGYRNTKISATAGARDVQLPDPKSRKSLHLVRLVPGRNLFRLRDDRDDEKYVLTVLRGDEVLHQQRGIRFETLYLGSALHTIEDVHGKPEHRSELAEYAGRINTPAERLESLVTRWVNHKRGVETKDDFRDRDRIRVVLSKGGRDTFNETIDIKPDQMVNTVFLTGAMQ